MLKFQVIFAHFADATSKVNPVLHSDPVHVNPSARFVDVNEEYKNVHTERTNKDAHCRRLHVVVENNIVSAEQNTHQTWTHANVQPDQIVVELEYENQQTEIAVQHGQRRFGLWWLSAWVDEHIAQIHSFLVHFDLLHECENHGIQQVKHGKQNARYVSVKRYGDWVDKWPHYNDDVQTVFLFHGQYLDDE